MPKIEMQQVETAPIDDIKQRISDLNHMGRVVVALTIDRERGQFWIVTSSTPDTS